MVTNVSWRPGILSLWPLLAPPDMIYVNEMASARAHCEVETPWSPSLGTPKTSRQGGMLLVLKRGASQNLILLDKYNKYYYYIT